MYAVLFLLDCIRLGDHNYSQIDLGFKFLIKKIISLNKSSISKK